MTRSTYQPAFSLWKLLATKIVKHWQNTALAQTNFFYIYFSNKWHRPATARRKSRQKSYDRMPEFSTCWQNNDATCDAVFAWQFVSRELVITRCHLTADNLWCCQSAGGTWRSTINVSATAHARCSNDASETFTRRVAARLTCSTRWRSVVRPLYFMCARGGQYRAVFFFNCPQNEALIQALMRQLAYRTAR